MSSIDNDSESISCVKVVKKKYFTNPKIHKWTSHDTFFLMNESLERDWLLSPSTLGQTHNLKTERLTSVTQLPTVTSSVDCGTITTIFGQNHKLPLFCS